MPEFNFVTIQLSLSGLLALVIGVRGLIAPKVLGEGLGYGMAGADAFNEVRAQYGGFFLAVALVSGLAVAKVIPQQAGLIVLAVTFGGVLFGRLISLLADRGRGPFSPTIRALYVVDALGFGTALWALTLTN